MSANQKRLKIMSFISILAALGMAAFTCMSFMFANNSIGLLLALCVLVPAVLDVLLGCWGVGAANKPARAMGLYYLGVAWLAVVLGVASVVVCVMLDAAVLPSAINLVIMALYLYFLRGVRAEALR